VSTLKTPLNPVLTPVNCVIILPNHSTINHARFRLHREYPAEASSYELLEDCGRGVSATVNYFMIVVEPIGGTRRHAQPLTGPFVPQSQTRRLLNAAPPFWCQHTQVHRAICKPMNEEVAVKKMNLESINCNLVGTR